MNIADIKYENKKAGFFFFSPDTIKFFASKFVAGSIRETPDYCYFITSEKKCFDDYTRVFSVRKFDKKNGDIETVEDCHGLATKAEAQSKIDDIINRGGY